jgi:hypothetical protein
MEEKPSPERRTSPTRWFYRLGALFLFAVLLSYGWRCCSHYAGAIRQKAVFASVTAAMELWRHEFKGYPPSDALDDANQPYCGAMKLTEAMVGQDLLGFRPTSAFRQNGTHSNTGELLYATAPPSIQARTAPFLHLTYVAARRLADIYGSKKTGPFPGHIYVLESPDLPCAGLCHESRSFRPG